MTVTCSVRFAKGVATVVANGDIDFHTTSALREVLQTAVASPESSSIDIDLSQVTFLDSSALGVLIAAYRAAAVRGIVLAITSCGPVVKMVLEVTGLYATLVAPPAAPEVREETAELVRPAVAPSAA